MVFNNIDGECLWFCVLASPRSPVTMKRKMNKGKELTGPRHLSEI